MSLLPLIFENFHSTPTVRRENCGVLSPFIFPREIEFLQIPSFRYYRPSKSLNEQKDIGSEISTDKDNFKINLDVQHFSPEEITVKTLGNNTIMVEAKHEEKEDEHGLISRQFVRKYILPKGHNIEELQSKLSSDGVLTITAPRIQEKGLEYRTIPVTQTGIPSVCGSAIKMGSKCTKEENQEKEDEVPVEDKTI